MKQKENEKPEIEAEAKNLVESIFLGGNETPTETDRDKVVEAWLNDKFIETKTEYNQNQVYAVTVLETLANQWNIKPLKKLIQNFRKNQLSKGRGTSNELVDILKNRDSSENSMVKRWGDFLK